MMFILICNSKKKHVGFVKKGVRMLFQMLGRLQSQVMCSATVYDVEELSGITYKVSQSHVVCDPNGFEKAEGSHQWLLILHDKHIGVFKEKQ